MHIEGHIVDIYNRRIFPGRLVMDGERIKAIEEIETCPDQYILPGFIDAHIHIESSMLVPTAFGDIALSHGTVATVSDPHEIANVCGMEGVEYMIDNATLSPLKFHFGAPSCVPATSFETAGAVLGVAEVRLLLERDDVYYLSEMMNYPGVLFKDNDVLAKLEIAKELGKAIDGHAPGLTGQDAVTYIHAGITTDHECFTYDEAKWKLENGMKIIIREGSAAKNFEALIALLREYPDRIMFCSDDKHPDDLMVGHLNLIAQRALKKGHDIFDILQAMCINPIHHYSLPVGSLREGDWADCIVVKDLETFEVILTIINGEIVYENGKSRTYHTNVAIINNFHPYHVQSSDFEIAAIDQQARIIHALDGELITKITKDHLPSKKGQAICDLEKDYLKIAVVNRYHVAKPAVAFIHGFGLQSGAIASSVAHDSHNIVAVGTNDEDLAKAVNLLMECKGGVAVVDGEMSKVLPLPIGGIMSDRSGEEVGKAYQLLDQMTKDKLGSKLRAPFMTLSFMALLVIPDLKLSDKGLFSGAKFEFVGLAIPSTRD